jgi:hypothetical protein
LNQLALEKGIWNNWHNNHHLLPTLSIIAAAPLSVSASNLEQHQQTTTMPYYL